MRRRRPRAAALARQRRRPSRWRRWARRAVATLAVLMAGGALWWLLTAPVFAVRRVTTSPCRYVPRDTLAALARPWLGRNLWRCRPGRLADRIAALPWVATVSVRRRPPATLAVVIGEHRPLLLLDEPPPGRGAQVLLEDGRVARIPDGLPPPDLPLLAGPASPVTAKGPAADSLRSDLVALCRAVIATALETAAAPVDFVRIAPEGYRLLLGDHPRCELWLGREDFTGRLRRYLAVRDRLDPGGIVDLRFRHQVTRRPRPPAVSERGGGES